MEALRIVEKGERSRFVITGRLCACSRGSKMLCAIAGSDQIASGHAVPQCDELSSLHCQIANTIIAQARLGCIGRIYLLFTPPNAQLLLKRYDVCCGSVASV